jgi:hypothetical protein
LRLFPKWTNARLNPLTSGANSFLMAGVGQKCADSMAGLH